MTRTTITAVSSAVLWMLTLAPVLAVESPTTPVAEAMTQAATQILASLSTEERAKVERPFNDPARLDWHNIPKPQRKGLQIREMNADQRKLCHALLRTGLSDTGYQKAVLIMSLESNLLEGEKGNKNAPLRDPERYFLTIFGKPDKTGPWGWSFEGHHFSLNFVIQNGTVVADSPSFWGANPATVKVFVPGGPDVGTRTLADEEQLAFDLVNALNPEQRKQAIIAEKAPADYRQAGQPTPPRRIAAGLPAKSMTDEQKALLRKLLVAYSSHLAPSLAAARIAEFDADGWNDVYFAWSGATQPGVGHAFWVEAPSVVLELVNIQSDPQGNPANHIHSVWRNPKGDFAMTLP